MSEFAQRHRPGQGGNEARSSLAAVFAGSASDAPGCGLYVGTSQVHLLLLVLGSLLPY